MLEYNTLATLLFNTEGATVRGYLGYGTELAAWISVVYFFYWFFLSVISYGTAVPAGLFFPGILMGCALGHFIAKFFVEMGLIDSFKSQTYAIIGGAAVLAGYTRLSFCLAVLLMETTTDVNLFIPMLLAVMIARFVGSLFNPSLYKNAIKMKHLPMTTRKVKDRAKRWRVRDIMHAPVISFKETETVRHIYDVLFNTTHNGFPIVDRSNRVIGLISKHNLITAIENRAFIGQPLGQA